MCKENDGKSFSEGYLTNGSGERGRHFTVLLSRANHKEFKVVGEETLILTELAVWCEKLRCRMGR